MTFAGGDGGGGMKLVRMACLVEGGQDLGMVLY